MPSDALTAQHDPGTTGMREAVAAALERHTQFDEDPGGRVARAPFAAGPADLAAGLSQEETARIVADVLALGPRKYGRYVVLEELGAGGMGMVYRAYDPKLCREVALKVLRSEMLDPDSEARMFREARAMAQLSHPNVLPVYDVESDGDTVFITMELVRGGNLAHWIKTEQPDYEDVLRVFRAAARGLAAAHEHGMVHRDFKLANVMVGDDGRVRVMDFGLAKGTEPFERVEDTPVRISVDVAPDGVAQISSDLTQQGVVMGTPAYMAPEQFSGRPASPASDQYAFCVGLYEALYGTRPFKSRNYRELARLKKKTPVPEPPEGAKVPRWVFPILVKGLHVDPETRHASMTELARALEVDPGRRSGRRQRHVLLTAGGGALALGLLLGLVGLGRSDRCASQQAEIDELWTGPRRAAISASFAAADTEAGQATRLGLEAVDRYVERLRRSTRGACEAAVTDQSVPEQVYARQLSCFADRRRDLAALVEVFGDADAELVRNAVDAVADLDPVALCEDEAYVMSRSTMPRDRALAEQIELNAARLSRAEALERAGRYAPALAMLDGIGSEASELGYAPLRVEVTVTRGRVLSATDRLDAARKVLHQAYFDASEGGLHAQAAEAARELAYLEGHTERDYDTGQLWLRLAGVSTRLGPHSPVLEAELLVAEANVLEKAGRLHEAGERYEEAHGVLSRELGANHPRALRLLYNRGNMARALGRHDEAKGLLEDALGRVEHVLGPEHPLAGRIWTALGTSHVETGAYEEAAGMHRRAGEIFERSFGGEHQLVAMAALNEAVAHSHRGDADAAVPAYERARRIFAVALGPEHPNVAAVLNNLGAFFSQLERYEDAAPYFREALELAEARLGAEHPDVADAHGNLGLNACRLGRFDVGIGEVQQSATLLAERLGPMHPRVAQAHVNLGYCQRRAGLRADALGSYTRAAEIRRATVGEDAADYAAALSWQGKLELETGRLEQAREHLDACVAIYEADPATTLRVLALARYEAARAHRSSGDRSRARKLAEASIEGLEAAEAAGTDVSVDLAQVRAWMREAGLR